MMPTLNTHTNETILRNDPLNIILGANDSWGVSYNFNGVGMYAFDFACETSLTSTGEITKAEMSVLTDNVERVNYRGSRTWTRVFVPVDTGNHSLTLQSNNSYRDTDKVHIRRLYAHVYNPSPYIAAIDQLKPPKPLSGLQQFDTLEGALRIQRTGNNGCEIEFTLIFEGEANFNAFMNYHHDEYMVFKCSYGVYGGYLNGTDSEPEVKGPLRLLRVKMISPQRAGVGVNGI